jgi:hypothetical protein
MKQAAPVMIESLGFDGRYDQIRRERGVSHPPTHLSRYRIVVDVAATPYQTAMFRASTVTCAGGHANVLGTS